MAMIAGLESIDGGSLHVDAFQPGNHAQQGGLAAAGGADEDDELVLVDVEINALDGAVVGEEFFNAAKL